MTLDQISDALDKIDSHFRSIDPDTSDRERLFSRIIKLNEEVGELCEAVLSEHDKNQRVKEKDIDLDSELADVIICTLLIAHNRDTDIWKSVSEKLTKQLNRFDIK